VLEPILAVLGRPTRAKTRKIQNKPPRGRA
jgi:hypothetical protein